MKIIISYIPPTSKKHVRLKTKKFFQSNKTEKTYLSHDLLFNVYKNAVEILLFDDNESNYSYIGSYINYVFKNCIIGLTVPNKIDEKKLPLQGLRYITYES